MAYLKKTKRSKRKMRKTMRIRGGSALFGTSSEKPTTEPVPGTEVEGVKSEANAVSGAQNAGLATVPDQAAPDTKQQVLAELEQAMAGLNKAVELLKQ